MNLDERVEAAARVLRPEWWTDATSCERTEFWDDDRVHPLDNYAGQHRKFRELSLEQAATVLRAAFPELFSDPPQVWIAPVELNLEKQLEIVGKWAAWVANEVAEIDKAVKAEVEASDELMQAQSKGWGQGFQSLSGDELRVVWDAARTAHLNRRDGE